MMQRGFHLFLGYQIVDDIRKHYCDEKFPKTRKVQTQKKVNDIGMK